MARDPPRDAYTDGRQLLPSDPHAGEPLDPSRGDAVVGGRANQDLFQISNVAVNVAPIGCEIDDRIADDLTGPVICNVAAAAGFVHLDTARSQRLGRRENMRSAAAGARTERQHVRMLEEQQQVVDAARPPVVGERTLQRQRVAIRDEPEPAHIERSHRPHLTHLAS